MRSGVGFIGGVSLALMLYKGYKVLTENNSGSMDETSSTDTTSTSTTAKKPVTSLTVWESWAKEFSTPVDWNKQIYNSGVRNKYVAQILCVLRSKKDLGYNTKNLTASWDDNGRTTYLKWGVKRWIELKLDIRTLPTVYKKAFNQDLKAQYQTIYSKVVPLMNPTSASDLWKTQQVGSINLF